MRNATIWSILLLFFFLSHPGWSAEPAIVATTARLNLRSCPGTADCPVLSTLPIDSRIEVLGREGEWLRVRVLSDGGEGWVHSEYTQPAALSPRPPSFTSFFAQFTNWKTLAFLMIAMLLVSQLVRKLQDSERQVSPPSAMILGSFVLGSFFLLNQFGPLISTLVARHVDISPLSFIWGMNAAFKPISYSKVVMVLVLLAAAIGAAAPTANGGRNSFLQGLGSGFLLLPMSCLAGAVAIAVGWLLLQVFKLIAFIVGLILIPFSWLFEHLLFPILKFLAIPFVWLWENFLRELALLLATPFVWLWNVVLSPLVRLIMTYILRPLLALALGVLVAMLYLLPIAVVGLALLEALRSSLRAPLSPFGLFSQGMAVGLLLFDATLLIILDAFGVLQSTPPITVLVLLLLPVITLLRLLASRETGKADEGVQPWMSKLRWYYKSSKVELLSTCVVFPALMVVSVFMGGGEE